MHAVDLHCEFGAADLPVQDDPRHSGQARSQQRIDQAKVGGIADVHLQPRAGARLHGQAGAQRARGVCEDGEFAQAVGACVSAGTAGEVASALGTGDVRCPGTDAALEQSGIMDTWENEPPQGQAYLWELNGETAHPARAAAPVEPPAPDAETLARGM